MSEVTLPKCPQCGTVLGPSAPAGLCPNCLMALNLKTETVLPGEALHAQPPLPAAQIAPHFPQLEILECLGRGGMGVVYKARQKTLNRLVALKLLAPERVHDAKFADRFAREAQALAALNHPNIVTIHDFGQSGGFYFLLMEFVDGVNLRELLRARKFTPEEALAVVPPLCDALQYAHERGIVHRDIKPENILLDKAGRVKVADFGIAKMLIPGNGGPGAETAGQPSGTQSVVGTRGYSAPEQETSPERVDSRADIYSLGVVFYEMLTGELPGSRLEPPSKKVQIDVRLDEVVLRALEQRPELRYQQASVLKTTLETIASTPGPAGGASPAGGAFRQDSPLNSSPSAGLDYRSKATFLGMPLLHVTAGIDPLTGRERVARGIIAIGGRAQGFVAIGGVATGGLAFGGLALGVVAFGGCAFGLISIGGLAVALLLALGGGSIAPIALGGGAIGYLAFGGEAWGKHVLDAVTRDPVATNFFLPWARTLSENMQVLLAPILAVIIGIGVGVPRWLLRQPVLPNRSGGAARPPSDRGSGLEPGRSGFPVFSFCVTASYAAAQVVGALGELLRLRFPVLGLTGAFLLMGCASLVAGFLIWQFAGRRAQQIWCRITAWLALIASLPIIGFAVFFVTAMATQSGGWHPGLEEAIVVPLIWLGSILLPLCAIRLWRAARALRSANDPSFGDSGLAEFPIFPVVGGGLVLVLILLGMTAVRYARQRASASAVAALEAKQLAADRALAEELKGKAAAREAGSPANRVNDLPLAEAEEFQFRWVAAADDTNSPADELPDASDAAGQRTFRVLRPIVLTGSDVASAEFLQSNGSHKDISVRLSAEGGRKFAQATAGNIGRSLAIVWRGHVITAPVVRSAITGGRITITGRFTDEEAQAVLKVLNHQQP